MLWRGRKSDDKGDITPFDALMMTPFMAIAYVAGDLVVILFDVSAAPTALGMIVEHAFTSTAATGGFAGAAVWLVADTLNALMAIPNLIALLLLSPVVFKLTRSYFAQAEAAAEEG